MGMLAVGEGGLVSSEPLLEGVGLGDVGADLIIPRRVEKDHHSPPISLHGDCLLSVLELVVVPRGFQGVAIHCDLCFEDFLVGGQVRDSPASHLGQFLLHIHGVV